MKKFIIIMLCLTSLFMAGCKSKLHVSPFEGEVPLTYGESSGSIRFLTEVGNYQIKLPTADATLDYSVKEQGDALLWRVEAHGKFLGYKDGKAVKVKTINELFGLYPLVESHEGLIFTMKTDRLGNVVGMQEYLNAKTGEELADDYWKDYYTKLFSVVFVPFATENAQMNTVVSSTQCAIQPEYQEHFPSPAVSLTGQRVKFGNEYLVLQYENTSEGYKNKSRQKCTDTVKVDFIIDKQTRIVHKAKAVLRGENGFKFFTITAAE
jgi:hypothetical protein